MPQFAYWVIGDVSCPTAKWVNGTDLCSPSHWGFGSEDCPTAYWVKRTDLCPKARMRLRSHAPVASLEAGRTSDWPTANQQVEYDCRTRKRPGTRSQGGEMRA